MFVLRSCVKQALLSCMSIKDNEVLGRIWKVWFRVVWQCYMKWWIKISIVWWYLKKYLQKYAKKYKNNCIMKEVLSQCGELFSYSWASSLWKQYFEIQEKIAEDLASNMWKVVSWRRNKRYYFPQSNPTAHITKTTTSSIRLMFWFIQSPDLKPKETI